jgi:hypothetical protein
VTEAVVLDALHRAVHPQYDLRPGALTGGRWGIGGDVRIELLELVADDLDLAVQGVRYGDGRARGAGIVVVGPELRRGRSGGRRRQQAEDENRQ